MIRILVADDNEEMRQAMAEYLQQQDGMKVVGQTGSGVETLRMVVETQPDVLLLDMIMPNTDGFGVLQQLQNLSAGRRPKTIAVTALGRDDFVRRAVSLGVSFYMIKPVDMETLTRRIQ